MSAHETAEDAAAYAGSLRGLYGMGPIEEEGTKERLRVCVIVRGSIVGSAMAKAADRARRDAEGAIEAVGGR